MSISIVRGIQFSRTRFYRVNFFGDLINVTVTSTPTAVKKWLRKLFRSRNQKYPGKFVVGVGVQWNPEKDYPSADILQLCVDTECLIFQLSLATNVPWILRGFLRIKKNTFVGIWNGGDARRLRRSGHELRVRDLIDLRNHVTARDGSSLAMASVARIVEQRLGYGGVTMDRNITKSRWDNEILEDEQVLQACVKAYVAYEIGWNWHARRSQHINGRHA